MKSYHLLFLVTTLLSFHQKFMGTVFLHCACSTYQNQFLNTNLENSLEQFVKISHYRFKSKFFVSLLSLLFLELPNPCFIAKTDRFSSDKLLTSVWAKIRNHGLFDRHTSTYRRISDNIWFIFSIKGRNLAILSFSARLLSAASRNLNISTNWFLLIQLL